MFRNVDQHGYLAVQTGRGSLGWSPQVAPSSIPHTRHIHFLTVKMSLTGDNQSEIKLAASEAYGIHPLHKATLSVATKIIY